MSQVHQKFLLRILRYQILQAQGSFGSEAVKLMSERLDGIAKKRNRYTQNLKLVETSVSESIDASESAEFIKEKLVDFENGFSKAPAFQKKRLIRKTIKQIAVTRENLAVWFYLNEDDEQIPGRKLKLVRDEVEKPGLSLVSEVVSQPSVLSSDIGGNGDPSLLLSERIYPIDFKPHFFETRNRISLDDAKSIAEKYENGCSLRDIAEVIGCSKSKIRTTLKRRGIKPRESSTQATHERSLASGKQGALPYYGFCYFEGQIVKDPREFPILQLIHRHWSQRKSIHQINLELNRAKILSRKGKTWSWAAIQNIVVRFETRKVILSKGGKYEFR